MNSQAVYIIKGSLLFILIIFSFFLADHLITKGTFKGEPESVFVPVETESRVSPEVSKGKNLFVSKCASCHNIYKDMTGPALIGLETRGPWSDREKVYEWIKNPSNFMKKNEYTKNLKEKFGSVMTAFPDITNDEIDLIIQFINSESSEYSKGIVSR